jgi:hypothetical protein
MTVQATYGQRLLTLSGTDYALFHIDADRALRVNGSFSEKTVTLTPDRSPWTWRNGSTERQKLSITGGTVSKIEIRQANDSHADTGVTTSSNLIVPPEGHVRVTFSSAPTITATAIP